jgi:hypothetical protein
LFTAAARKVEAAAFEKRPVSVRRHLRIGALPDLRHAAGCAAAEGKAGAAAIHVAMKRF